MNETFLFKTFIPTNQHLGIVKESDQWFWVDYPTVGLFS